MINIREFLGLGYYTSELDSFLSDFDKKNPQLSCSQQQEVKKYQRVFALRDKPMQDETQHTFWENF